MSEHIKLNQPQKDNKEKQNSSQNIQGNSEVQTITPSPNGISVQGNQNSIQRVQTNAGSKSLGYIKPNSIQRMQALPDNEKPDYFKQNAIQKMQADPNNTYFQPNIIQRMQALPDNEKPAYFQPNAIQRLQALPEKERPAGLQPNLIQRLQRKQAEEENLAQLKSQEEEAVLQGKFQLKEEPVAKLSSEPSKKMPETVQAKMENSFGSDFSNVNIHEGDNASKVNALAYTQGNDIHFATGQYNPESKQGQELLGHELTHVVQQQEGRVKPTIQKKGVAVNDDKGLEKEADEMGKLAAQGEFAEVRGNGSGIQKKEIKDIPEADRKKIQVSMDNNEIEGINNRDYFDREIPLTEDITAKKLADSAEFAGVDPIIQPGIKRMLEMFLHHKLIPVNTSITKMIRFSETRFLSGNLTLESNIRNKGNQNIAYRFTHYQEKSVVKEKTIKTPKILVEELGEVKERVFNPIEKIALKNKFEKHFSIGSGFEESEKETLYDVVSKLPDTTLACINGLKFKRAGVNEKDPREAGVYDPNTHTITLFDLAFTSTDYLLGDPVKGFYNFAQMTMFHEIGHAVDAIPSRPALNKMHNDANKYNDLATQYNDGNKSVLDQANLAKAEATKSEADFNTKHTHSGNNLMVETKIPTKADTGFLLALKADGNKAITSYGSKGIGENFAECYALFYTDPDRLLLLRPNIYAYFKNKKL
jgi:hypothetical protein